MDVSECVAVICRAIFGNGIRTVTKRMRNQVNQVLYVFELVLAVLPCFRVVLYGFFINDIIGFLLIFIMI